MATLQLSPSADCPETVIADSGVPELDAQSEVGRKLQEAVQEALRPRNWTATAAARQILRTALQRYRRPEGYEGDLIEAAWQLEQIGADAWPVLRELAFSRLAECEFFLGAMVRIETAPSEERRWGLLAAAKGPDVNVRSRLLELVDELPAILKREVVRVLAADDRPDDAATDRARAALTVLEPQSR